MNVETKPATAASIDKAEAARVLRADLVRFIAAAFVARGLPAADAAKVAELMTEADLTGADAHGVFRLPQYIRRLDGGAVNPAPRIEVKRTGPATALVEGDNGMGHLVMARATETAIELAREAGVAWVGVRRSNHAGPAALYAEIPVRHGLVGIYSVVASANHMAAWGGIDSLLGTNPLAVGIPCGDAPPVVLDIATTVVSYGTVKKYVQQERTLPDDWMFSREDGKPVTDPRRTAEGLLRPIGGHKGSGLALVLGLLAGTMNDAAFGRDVVDFNADSTTETNTGHFILVVDPARFVDPSVFAAEVKRHLADLRASETMPGADPVRMPGDQRAARRAERAKDGVPLPPALHRQLDELAATLGIERLATHQAS